MEAELAGEYYRLKLQEDAVKERLQAIRDVLIAKTGKRMAGDYQINVSSSSVERLDTELARTLLLEKGVVPPIQVSVSVRLSVKPAIRLEAQGLA